MTLAHGPRPPDPFARGAAPEAVGRHAARGVTWTLGLQWVTYVMTLFASIVISRYITPAEFGRVAMVVAFTALADQFRSLGLTQALVQRTTITQAETSKLFWVTSGMGVVITLVVALCAPLISAFYRRDDLTPVVLVLSTVYMIAGLSVVPGALLLRRMEYRRIATRNLMAAGMASVVGIALAFAGAGWFAVAAVPVTQALGITVFTVIVARWLPSSPRTPASVGPHLRFGANLSLVTLLDYLARNADNLLVGRYLGAGQLGLYARAYSLTTLPLRQLNQPVAAVTTTSLAALRAYPSRYRRLYTRAICGLAYAGATGLLVAGAQATDLLTVVLGPQWAGAGPLFALLALGGAVQVVSYSNGWLFTSSGRVGVQARWALVSRPLQVAGFAIGLHWGAIGVAASYADTQIMLGPVGIAVATRGTSVSMRDVGGVLWRPYVLASTAAAAGWAANEAMAGALPVVRLLVGLSASALVLAGALLVSRRVRGDLLGFVATVRRREDEVVAEEAGDAPPQGGTL